MLEKFDGEDRRKIFKNEKLFPGIGRVIIETNTGYYKGSAFLIKMKIPEYLT